MRGGDGAGPPEVRQDNGVVSVSPGANVTLHCFLPTNALAMHRSWYRQGPGGPPRLLSAVYKYGQEERGRPRLEVSLGNGGLNYLSIADVRRNDSAVYYCGSAHSNVVEFADGIFLHVRGSEDQPQPFLHRGQGVHRFWCKLNCGTGCTATDDATAADTPTDAAEDACHRQVSAAMRVLVLLSIGRTASLLLCVIASLLCTFKSLS
ncbi:hypothetical protein NHX12_014291 [Muraenolepis orangiensis]|uniref:Ig-like domain-containing protein n=1 Tax=Muraenolepis orangiensis TaxID=630683 RepID=A0A9Q0DF93_9TELE|nr:hypothetical protein NHX12_014291 [Muraenolepis orangiensis]